MKLTFLAELLCTPLFSLWPLLNHQLSECLASSNVYHRSIADPLPCHKPMRGNKVQQNSNTYPLYVIARTLNVPFIVSGQKYVLMECIGRIENVILGTAGL